MIQKDKLLHIIASFSLMVGFNIFTPLAESIAIVALIGLLKEVYDLFHINKHNPEIMDIVADLGGIGIYLIVYYLWRVV